MREYSKVSPRFWIDEMGKKIKKYGVECRLISIYLLTCPSSNMIGMYYLPLSTISNETGISLVKVKRIINQLKAINFCDYDDYMEHVWVKDMAYYEIGELKENDNRIKYCNKEYKNVPNLIFSEEFYDVYFKFLGILEKKCNRAEQKFEKPSKNLNKPIKSVLKNDDLSKSKKSVLIDKEPDESDVITHQDTTSPSEAPLKPETITETITETETKTYICRDNGKRKISASKNEDVQDVFNHWKKIMKKRSDVSLDTQRERVILKAIMKLGYSPKMLKDAIEGCSLSSFHMGKNEQNVRYDQLSTIFKSPEQIDKFLEIYEDNKKIGFIDVQSHVVRNNIKEMKEWVEDEDENILLEEDNVRNFNR